jgi:hypothetical protein
MTDETAMKNINRILPGVVLQLGRLSRVEHRPSG